MESDAQKRLLDHFCWHPTFRKALFASDPVMFFKMKEARSMRLLTPADISGLEFKTIRRFGHEYYDADQVDNALENIELSIRALYARQQTLEQLIKEKQ